MSQVVACPKVSAGIVTQRYYAFIFFGTELLIYNSVDGGNTWEWLNPATTGTLPPLVATQPSVITYATTPPGGVSSNISAFVFDTDNILWCLSSDDPDHTSWTWTHLGSPPTSPYAASPESVTQVNVAQSSRGAEQQQTCTFVVTEDGHLWVCCIDTYLTTGFKTSNWVDLGVPNYYHQVNGRTALYQGKAFGIKPAAVPFYDYQTQAFFVAVIGDDGDLYTYHWDVAHSNGFWLHRGAPQAGVSLLTGEGFGATCASYLWKVTTDPFPLFPYPPGAFQQRIYTILPGSDEQLWAHYSSSGGFSSGWLQLGVAAPGISPINVINGAVAYMDWPPFNELLYSFALCNDLNIHVSYNMGLETGAPWQWSDPGTYQGSPNSGAVQNILGAVVSTEVGPQQDRQIYAFFQPGSGPAGDGVSMTQQLYLYYWNGTEWQWRASVPSPPVMM